MDRDSKSNWNTGDEIHVLMDALDELFDGQKYNFQIQYCPTFLRGRLEAVHLAYNKVMEVANQ